jgi:hypothetical protein
MIVSPLVFLPSLRSGRFIYAPYGLKIIKNRDFSLSLERLYGNDYIYSVWLIIFNRFNSVSFSHTGIEKASR